MTKKAIPIDDVLPSCPITSGDSWMLCALPSGHGGPHDLRSVAIGDKLCTAYDQISDRTCRYYAGHGGRHNFARLVHDCAMERELRRALDVMTAARDEACEIADSAIKMRGDFIGSHDKRGSLRIVELRKVGS
jgi:hypothetical protein